MEQKKTMNWGMAVLLSAALVPTVGVPATAFAEEAGQVQGGAVDGAVASNDATTPSTATGVTLTVNPAGVQCSGRRRLYEPCGRSCRRDRRVDDRP